MSKSLLFEISTALRGHVKTKHESTSYTCENCNKNLEMELVFTCLSYHVILQSFWMQRMTLILTLEVKRS